MADGRLDTETRKLLKLREDHERKDAAAKKAKAERETQEEVVMELMDDLNQTSAKVDLGGDIGVIGVVLPKPTVFARVIDKDVALQSLRDLGMEEAMIDRTIRKAPANQLIRERLENKEDPPDGFDFSESASVRIERKKKK
ncbi:MAG TPA: hypothetical protein VG777_00890 [Thermoanaerobaculia bacterium]|nr:hypothetical protein [Thermoanaerobaculia bacterium]